MRILCSLFECYTCKYGCKWNATDREVEKLWEELKDVPVYENEKFELCLDVGWQSWLKGTDVETIWRWFDKHHSKGVGWLMNEYKPDIE